MNAATRLMSLFDRRDAQGNLKYRREEVCDALAMVFLLSPPEGVAIPDSVKIMMGDFAARIGFSGRASDPPLHTLLAQYRKAHPPSPGLTAEVRALLKGKQSSSFILRG